MHACTDGQIKAVGVSVGGKRQEKGAGRGGVVKDIEEGREIRKC